MTNEPPYEYRPRDVGSQSERFFRFGEGRISGALAVTLGALCVLAVLCFRYPTYLTTAELRAEYDTDLLRTLLGSAMVLSLSFGVLTFILDKRRKMGAVGVLLTAVAYLLGGHHVEAGALGDAKVALGVDWMVLDFLGSAALFIFIEKLIPKYREQAILRPEWQLDLLYFVVNHLLVGVLLIVGNGFAPSFFDWAVNASLREFITSLPVTLQVVTLIFCADFVQYWSHRAFHEIPRLWRIHAVHHCTEHMDWLAGSRNHILQLLWDRSVVMVPLYLLGTSEAALNGYVIFAAHQAVFIHANVGLNFGWFNYVLTTPQFHHWHHSSEKPAIDTNYAVHLPLYDLLFGTFHTPRAHWPAHYGATKRLPRTFWGQFLYPFQRK